MNAKQLEFNFDDKPEPNKIIEPIFQVYYPNGSTGTVSTNSFYLTSNLIYETTTTSGSSTFRYIYI